MGGTFDPIHFGHLIMAESVMQSFNADGMLFVPACIHPLKPQTVLTNYIERVEMVRLAIEDNQRFRLEEPPRHSGYTIDLIDHLRHKYPNAEFFLPVGSDIVDEFESWYRGDEIARSIRIIVASRPGYRGMNRDSQSLAGAERIEIPQYDISSTEIRNRVRMRLSIKYMVPAGVEKYILAKGLYVH
jgi:nicotinate-nucleotide adenylyltransferase